MELQNRKALIIGMGTSGRSAARFLLHHGASVVGMDKDPTQPLLNDFRDQMTLLPESASFDFDAVDFIVISPGIPQSHPQYQNALESKKEIMGEVELAARFIRQPVVGITGTNGKTTVTLLVTHVLNHFGVKARALGNVGMPLAEELLQLDDTQEILILELSSYQLETLKTPILNAAVILNITPDHLDRYHSMEEYALAKWHIQDALKLNAPLYVYQEAYQQFSQFSKSKVYKYGTSHDCDLIISTNGLYDCSGKIFAFPDSLRHKISHEHQNLTAAYLICSVFDITGAQFIEAYQTFQKPPHRIEFVREVNGVSYVDDSKGTNVDAVTRAVEAMPGRVILIAGGVDKGTPYTCWVQSFNGKVAKICAIGESASKIEQELSAQIPVERFHTLAEAVNAAKNTAKPGDTVLLSPGCSSFDMFKDYAHRGNEFKRIVQQL